MNVSRVMEAARKHYKITLGACGCSICAAIKKPDICPDLEELISYNKSVSARKQEQKVETVYIPPPMPNIYG
jgi:hypothetical protein